jgi:hypothetical protein
MEDLQEVVMRRPFDFHGSSLSVSLVRLPCADGR